MLCDRPAPMTTPATYPDKSRATLALVLSILSWVLLCSLLAAIPGLVLGSMELKGIRLGRRAPDGRNKAIVAIVISGLNVIVSTVLLVVAGSIGLSGYRAGRELLAEAERRVPIESSDGTARIEIPGLWKVPEQRDPDYIFEANAPLGIAAFNAVRVGEEDGTTADSAAKVTMDTLREQQPSLKILAERRSTYGTLPVIEIDTSLVMDQQELRTYFAFIDGAHGIYQLTGTTAQGVDASLGPVIKGMFASFREVGPPKAAPHGIP